MVIAGGWGGESGRVQVFCSYIYTEASTTATQYDCWAEWTLDLMQCVCFLGQ